MLILGIKILQHEIEHDSKDTQRNEYPYCEIPCDR